MIATTIRPAGRASAVTVMRNGPRESGERVGMRRNRKFVGNGTGITRTMMVEGNVGSDGTEVGSETRSETRSEIRDGPRRTRTRETQQRGPTVLRQMMRSCWTSKRLE
jgi:hypothetical protein